VRESGLVRAGEPLLVLLSGGADSVCLLEVCVRLGARVEALHVNHGLRAEADADEAFCRELCERLGAPLSVERVAIAAAEPGVAGNVQAEARAARYAAAEGRVASSGGDYATAHTASDQAETVLYRLAVSPGRRALLGMEARRGRLVRPLLGVTRGETRAYCEARGLAWCEDPANADPRFARARIRLAVLPVLHELNPAAERNVAETALLLRDEAHVLEKAVDDALERVGRPVAPVTALRELPPALARLVLRRLAEEAVGRQAAFSRADADAVLALAERGGTRSLDLPGGVVAIAEYGTLRFRRSGSGTAAGATAAPESVRLPVPGRVRFGDWEVEARPVERGEAAGGDEEVVAAERLGDAVTVRAWRAGDRMRPAGLGGSKSLQDLFVDRKVPRALRAELPLVEARGEIAWVAGLCVAEGFAARREAKVGDADPAPLVALAARRARD
jgi:tRNA(Ile)-lysidine synthase